MVGGRRGWNHTWGSLGMGYASSLHPDNLWQAGEALPALQTHAQLVQLPAQGSAPSSFALSHLPGSGILSSLWHLRAASLKIPVWGNPKPCAV